jgi:hypothetical protein
MVKRPECGRQNRVREERVRLRRRPRCLEQFLLQVQREPARKPTGLTKRKSASRS